MGAYLKSCFEAKLAGDNRVKEIRGKGLMLGIELAHPCPQMVQQAFEQKLLINVTADSVIRLLPPLIINQAEADQIVDTICALITQS